MNDPNIETLRRCLFGYERATKSEATKSDQASLSDIGGTWIDALSLDDLCLNGSRVTIFS